MAKEESLKSKSLYKLLLIMLKYIPMLIAFDNYVREGKLPKGKHEIGFKELSWSKKDLDEFVRKSRDNHSLRSKLKSQLA